MNRISPLRVNENVVVVVVAGVVVVVVVAVVVVVVAVFGARCETTYADGEERTSALPPTAFGPYSPVKHKCLHKAYNGRWLTSFHRTINT